MQVERLLQIHIAAMVLLGTVLLGMGERNQTLPIWMTAVTVAAFWLTDVRGLISLNRTLVNIGAVVALLLSLLGLRRFDGLTQVFVIANLLVYLQVVLLFQKKEIRVYWLLMLLSLMEVVVAAAFEQEVWFGILLFGYLFAGLAAMTFLFLHQEQLRHHAAEPPPPPVPQLRWPLAQIEASFTSVPRGHTALGRELFFRMLRMTAVVAVLAAVVFSVMPRLGRGGWRQAAGRPLRAVGFSDSVALGELGRVIEDAHEVMRVRLIDNNTQELIKVRGSIYFRGAVLNHYRRGRWSFRSTEYDTGYSALPRPPVPYRQELVRQEITIEPMDRNELFSIWPFTSTQYDSRLIFNHRLQRLVRPRWLTRERFTYRLLTPALHHESQVPLVPYYFDASRPPDIYREPVPTEGPNGLPGLVALAEKWVGEDTLASKNRYACATLLERQLRTSKQFHYSLEGQPRDSHLDPIEDFVTKHPAGHCEYFATALALMLRSQGIPARVVVGYRCDEWNDLGQFYQVRQLDAHSWVEAYLPSSDVPPDVTRLLSHWDWSAGGWLRLDPTPVSDEISLTNRFLVSTDKYLTWLDYVWNNYIAEMDWGRQQRAVYDPAVKAVTDTGRTLLNPQRWREFFHNLGQRLHFRSWFRWQIGLAALATIAIVVVAYRWLRRFLRPYLAKWGLRRARRTRRRPPQVEFYRRLEAILARRGLVRAASQTPHELALLAREKLTQTTGNPQVAQLPEQLVDTFYRVRFGHDSLDKFQYQAVEQALRQLERAFRSTHEDRTGRL